MYGLTKLIAFGRRSVLRIQAALLGGVDAQFRLGQMYETGNGVHTDTKTALSWYGSAAAQGHADAAVHAQMLSVRLQYPRAMSDESFFLFWLLRAAQQGHAGARRSLSDLSALQHSGKGRTNDEAREDQEAHFANGVRLAESFAARRTQMWDSAQSLLDARSEEKRAVRELMRAHELGHADAEGVLMGMAKGGSVLAQAALGCLYAEGSGMVRDDGTAWTWWRHAAEGSEEGGHLTDEDFAFAFEPMVRSWARGAIDGFEHDKTLFPGGSFECEVGVALQWGRHEARMDLQRAVGWFRRAAGAGNGRALATLEWLQRAQQHVASYMRARKARFVPGSIYDGMEVREAAEAGSAVAQYVVGTQYIEDHVPDMGIPGMERFPMAAFFGQLWYGLAAARGHADAQFRLACLLRADSPGGAYALFLDSARQGHADAQFIVGVCLANDQLAPEERLQFARNGNGADSIEWPFWDASDYRYERRRGLQYPEEEVVRRREVRGEAVRTVMTRQAERLAEAEQQELERRPGGLQLFEAWLEFETRRDSGEQMFVRDSARRQAMTCYRNARLAKVFSEVEQRSYCLSAVKVARQNGLSGLAGLDHALAATMVFARGKNDRGGP